MADPLSMAASLLAISTAAFQSVKALAEIVRRYKSRDKTLARLQDEVDHLCQILDTLTAAAAGEESSLALLKGPTKRCDQVCREFAAVMTSFGRTSKSNLIDWARMEFMRGDINEFIEIVAGYKATISVGLGTVTMKTSRITQTVLSEYTEMIKDARYDLELRLQRIDEKMTLLTADRNVRKETSIDLRDERKVTEQCLQICEDASSFLRSLCLSEPSLLLDPPKLTCEGQGLEAQVQVRQTISEAQERFAQTSEQLSTRLAALLHGNSSDDDRQRLLLDIDISKQCIDVCKMAGELSQQKIYRVGEIVADGDSDQVVVTTLADLFDVGKAISRNNSAQLVGSMSPESLRNLTEKRYSSRFGAVAASPHVPIVDDAGSRPRSKPSENEQYAPGPIFRHEPTHKPMTTRNRPTSNEIKKRSPSSGIAEPADSLR